MADTYTLDSDIEPNLLHELFLKADFGVGSAEMARRFVNGPGGLWYHAIALLNAFYALNEEMVKRTKNAGDEHLFASIDSWREANKKKSIAFSAGRGRSPPTAARRAANWRIGPAR